MFNDVYFSSLEGSLQQLCLSEMNVGVFFV